MKKLHYSILFFFFVLNVALGQVGKDFVNKAKNMQDFGFSKKTNNAEIQKLFWEDPEVKAFTALGDGKSNTKMLNLKSYNLSNPVLDPSSGYYTMTNNDGKKTTWYSVIYTAQDEKTGKTITLNMLKNEEENDSRVWASDGVSFYKLKEGTVRNEERVSQNCEGMPCCRCQGPFCNSCEPVKEEPVKEVKKPKGGKN